MSKTAGTIRIDVSVTSATAIATAHWVGGLSGATNVWAASNGTTASNWATAAGDPVQALVPGPGATVTISATTPVTPPVSTVLGANMSIAGLTIADTVNGLSVDQDGFSLGIGSGGITMNMNVPASTIASDVVVAAGQGWTNLSIHSLTIGGSISGNAALAKEGSGTLILSGENPFTGVTNVNQGTLLVTGSHSASVINATGADSTLGGTGVVGGVTVNSGAILQGGDGDDAAGALSSGGNVSLLDGSIIKLALGPAGTHSSLSRTNGTWSFDSDQMFTFTNFGAAEGIYDNVISGLTGTEAGLATIGSWQIDPATGVAGSFSYDGSGGVDLVVVPEPGSAALLLASMSFLGLRRSRRKQGRKGFCQTSVREA